MLALILALSTLLSDGDMVTVAGWNPTEVGNYIYQQAQARGIDPTTALAAARSEGLNNPVGDAGRSFGPFQLYTGGGLGNSFQNATGLSPANYLSNWQAQVQWFLNWASQNGWNPGGVGLGSNYVGGTGGGLHGASAAGISNWQGLVGSHTEPLDFTQVPSNTIPPITGPTDIGVSPSTSLQPSTDIGIQTPAQTSITSGAAGNPTGFNLGLADSVAHIGLQFLLVIIAIALLLGGIYLLGSRK
jgi:hypothetical protein